MIKFEFPKEDRRLALAFFIAVLFHLLALFSGPSSHLGKRGAVRLSARLNPVQVSHPAPTITDRERVAPATKTSPEQTPIVAEPSTTEAGGPPGSNQELNFPGLAAPYLSVLDLTRHPEFETDIPSYLPNSITNTDGYIIFVLFIDENGVIDRIETTSEGGDLTVATRYLELLIRSTPIRPGEIDGVPVRTRWVLEFNVAPNTGFQVLKNSTRTSEKP